MSYLSFKTEIKGYFSRTVSTIGWNGSSLWTPIRLGFSYHIRTCTSLFLYSAWWRPNVHEHVPHVDSWWLNQSKSPLVTLTPHSPFLLATNSLTHFASNSFLCLPSQLPCPQFSELPCLHQYGTFLMPCQPITGIEVEVGGIECWTNWESSIEHTCTTMCETDS